MSEHSHPFVIKYVAAQTGLSQHVIRIWEKRYHAVQPLRSQTNRRFYSQEDIHKLSLLKELTERGHSIGKIAEFSLDELRDLSSLNKSSRHAALEPSVQDNVPKLIENCIESIKAIDPLRLQNLLDQAAVNYSQIDLLTKILAPLIDEIGLLWEKGKLRVAHEHFATTSLRAFLEDYSARFIAHSSAYRIVVTTPAQQNHELGALLAASIAQLVGWRVSYLGANLPAEEIAHAVQKTQADVLALSIVYELPHFDLAAELKLLRTFLGPHINIVCGGRATPHYAQIIQDISAQAMTSLQDFWNYLSQYQKKQNN